MFFKGSTDKTLLSISLGLAIVQSSFAQQPSVISLSPHITENIFSAGAGQQLIGAVEFSNYPAAAKQITRVGNHQIINLEKIIQLNPDFIFAWEDGIRPKDLKALQRLGFRVELFDSQNVAQIADEIMHMGKLLHTEAHAKQAAAELRSQLKKIKQKYQFKSPVSYFYQVWNRPLMTINDKQYISQALEYCNANNVFADLPLLASEVSLESLLSKNPQVILMGGNPKSQQQWLQDWQAYRTLQAVKNRQIHELNADLYNRPTARLIMSLETLCQVIDNAR